MSIGIVLLCFFPILAMSPATPSCRASVKSPSCSSKLLLGPSAFTVQVEQIPSLSTSDTTSECEKHIALDEK